MNAATQIRGASHTFYRIPQRIQRTQKLLSQPSLRDDAWSHRALSLTRPHRPPPFKDSKRSTFEQRRSINIKSTGSFKENLRILWRYHPFHVTGVSAILLTVISILVGLNYYYANYYSKQFITYPESVAKQMRKAWFYTEIELSPQQALKCYAKALEAAEELRMDAWSNEVIGIKESLIYLRQKAGDLRGAAKLCETLRADVISQSEAALSLTELDPPERQRRRTRLLKRSVQLSVKLAELYSDPALHNDASAMELLMWSVTTVLRETAARDALNATDESHGAWLSSDEFGASMEALGHKYEAANAHYLAAPLFLQALASKAKTDCHSVVLMNNLASCLAQQNPPMERGMPPADRAQLVRSGREWAEKALKVASELQPPVRDGECDEACATALYNLGEMAEMLDERSIAMEKYKEAVSLAKTIGFIEAEQAAKDALRRLKKT